LTVFANAITDYPVADQNNEEGAAGDQELAVDPEMDFSGDEQSNSDNENQSD
jgi:hypothetical protein